ncbi:DnaJ-domain-containing protein [Annulohypoxylon truncatum]|uniref:DnaJ-domain-containing protein n=1 Tax=Annulohypoxylon truncatum TaxID=327061 RepID=UPI0020086073|nr:DnaJ-domain-containing protein [Annulohypoxylon truncatum]KAI1212294.1 DnaJ-domain-containing protein [Annulohypoxylon truncatum]
MDKSDLLVYAKEYATTQDLYELLGVTSDTAKQDIHRAWRKRSLKYHPDKAGANFDPAKWELFERARDVLSDAAAREVYDSQRSAAQLREQQRRAMDAKRRAMVEDLEARERGGVKRPRDDSHGPTMSEAERRRLAEAGKRRLEERQRLMREAEARERQRESERDREQANIEDQQKSGPPKSEPAGRRKTPDASSAAESKTDIDPEPPIRNNDGYDDQIADIERKIREARLRKAAKKDKKAARENGGSGKDRLEAHQAKPIPDVPEELKADEKKDPSISSGTAKSFSFAPSTNASNSSNATASSKPRVKGDFSSTMARLRAAQAEKEARKKAEEAAAATSGAEVGS